MDKIKIDVPLAKDVVSRLKAGDEVLLSGVVFAARDAAHLRLSEMIRKGRRIPLNLKDAVIYYCGPTPASARRPIGSCGPTTSSRMDSFAPALMALGVSGMIGKGGRSAEVRKAIKKHGCAYFLAVGGAGAYLSTKVKSSRAVLFKELGPEAVYKIEVKDFPLIVGIDSKGNDLYEKAGWKTS